jgi:CheY-like chemotaxis protein
MANILFLEDQAFTGRMTEPMLTSAGHTVIWLRDGKAGLASFAANRPDLVITDLIMPVVGGLDVIRAIRAEAPTFPIIALSGGGHEGTYDLLEIALQLGVNEAIRKPVSRDEILAAVSRCLDLIDD